MTRKRGGRPIPRRGSATIRKPPYRVIPPSMEQITKTLRKEGIVTGTPTPASAFPHGRGQGSHSPIKHVEPPLQLDPEMIEPAAYQVIEPERTHGGFTSLVADTRVRPAGVSSSGEVVYDNGERRDLVEVVIELMQTVENLDTEVSKLKRRLSEHSHGDDNRRAKDDVNDRILEFLRKYSPMKVTTNTISANLELDTTQVGNRLRNMVGKNGVKNAKHSGANTVWWVEAP